MSESITRRRFLVAGASVLAVGAAALVGGTYARYKTEGSNSDSARVARFGVKINITGDLFSTAYATTETSVYEDAYSVQAISASDGGDDSSLLAPGTEGSGLEVSLEGKPEVAVKVVYELVGDLEEPFLLAGTYQVPWEAGEVVVQDNGYARDTTQNVPAYLPLRWALDVKTGTGAIYTNTDMNLKRDMGSLVPMFQEISENGSNDTSFCYDPGTDLANEAFCYRIRWDWPISAVNQNNNGGTVLHQDDNGDTVLGGLVAGVQGIKKKADDGSWADLVEGVDYCTSCAIGVKATVTQVD